MSSSGSPSPLTMHRQPGAISGSRGEMRRCHGTTIAGRGCRTMHAAVPRFFVEPDQVAGGRATLTGLDANHLSRALRAQVGETIVIVESGSVEHGLRLDEVTPAQVSGAIVWSRPVGGEPRLAVHVLQAVPAQAMDATVEALTEAGAATIRPVLTHRTVSRPDPSRVVHRLERWRADRARGRAARRPGVAPGGPLDPPPARGVGRAAHWHTNPRVRDPCRMPHRS